MLFEFCIEIVKNKYLIKFALEKIISLNEYDFTYLIICLIIFIKKRITNK